MKVNVEKYISWPNGVGALAVVLVFILQWIWVPSFAATWDMVDFSLGVLHFDMYQMQPHFPGYPYFILGGKALHLLVDDPAKALSLFNIMVYGSATIPVFLLLRRIVHPSYSVMALAIIYTSSFTVLMVNQPMSEGAAIGMMWWYIWGLLFAHDRHHNGFLILPLFMFSLLLGIRLSYLVLGLGILMLLYLKWKSGLIKFKEMPLYLLIGVLFQLLWVSAISMSEGGYGSFLRLALSFTNGHFKEWGGAIGASDLSLYQRVIKLVFTNTIWTGWLSESIPVLLLMIIVLFMAWKVPIGNSIIIRLMLVLLVSYVLWALFAQNVMKPRHALPLIGMGSFLIAVKICSGRQTPTRLFLLLFLLMFQVFHTGKLLNSHMSQVPAVYQLAHYLEEKEQPLIIYTWEESRVLEYLEVPYRHKKVQTYEVFSVDEDYYHNRDIYLTNKVVEGFKQQGVSIDSLIEVEKHFHSNELMDPIYHDLTLYKWKGKEVQIRKEENG